ncbi:MAG: MBL fold metallo-hydrolase [Spirochaetaceae bacterium]|jgi:glyoxylase-like metal-dependent hydrolase (beta-lactamase superfamily II)|nr:MBL fold metallo-hydrolase [Spirochaetaceae bacterium]
MHEKIVVGALETNCWLVPLDDTPREDGLPAAVIDPGADAEQIIVCLERRKLYPKYILLTHGHFDHIAGLPGLYKHYQKNPPLIAVGKDDLIYIGANSLDAHRKSFSAVNAAYYVDQLWETLPEAGRALNDGDTIGNFTVLHLPGHTKGSIAFWDSKNGNIFSGDTLFKNGVGRTDLPGGDERAMRNSLSRILSMDGNIKVYPGHGPETTISEGRRRLSSVAL